MKNVQMENYEVVNELLLGRFTIVEVKNEKGFRGVGISRRAQGDKERPTVGIQIAKNRAIKAILKKEEGKKINELLMG